MIGRLLRIAGAAGLAGVIAGFLVGGPGGRLAMRVSGALGDPGLIGAPTAAGSPVGTITVGGTLALAFFAGVLPGAIAGAAYAAMRPWLVPLGRPRVRARSPRGCRARGPQRRDVRAAVPALRRDRRVGARPDRAQGRRGAARFGVVAGGSAGRARPRARPRAPLGGLRAAVGPVVLGAPSTIGAIVFLTR